MSRFDRVVFATLLATVCLIAVGASATAFYIIYRNECCSPLTVDPKR